MNQDNEQRLPPGLDIDRLLGMYRRMRLIRAFEDTAKEKFESGDIFGVMHLSQGQEAVPVGTCTALRDDDYITSTHRGHGDVIAKGCEVKYMFAELYGRSTGYCKGKGGSMHIADFSQGVIGANGIVSGGLPISCGLGLSIKMRQSDQVAVCFFGDGATAEGGFHEALNLSSLWQLPVIFVCQNNLYAISNPWKDTAYQCSLDRRAATYNVPAQCVDGMDAVRVYEAVREAVDRARAGGGPSFIEANTYRFGGHFVGDPAQYRSDEEREEWLERDPIQNLGQRLRDLGYLTENEDDKMLKQVEEEIREGLEFAMSSPKPPAEDALEDLYVHFDYRGNPRELDAQERR